MIGVLLTADPHQWSRGCPDLRGMFEWLAARAYEDMLDDDCIADDKKWMYEDKALYFYLLYEAKTCHAD